jgi:hypothetical protein
MKALDEIERLQKENERLQSALTPKPKGHWNDD